MFFSRGPCNPSTDIKSYKSPSATLLYIAISLKIPEQYHELVRCKTLRYYIIYTTLNVNAEVI